MSALSTSAPASIKSTMQGRLPFAAACVATVLLVEAVARLGTEQDWSHHASTRTAAVAATRAAMHNTTLQWVRPVALRATQRGVRRVLRADIFELQACRAGAVAPVAVEIQPIIRSSLPHPVASSPSHRDSFSNQPLSCVHPLWVCSWKRSCVASRSWW